MAKIYAICGKLCSGKTTYCEGLRTEKHAALLSIDELMLAMFDPMLGESYDEISDRAHDYLLDKAAELTGLGLNVILDWGFWTRQSRESLRIFCSERGIELELCYLHVDDGEWARRIEKRNAQVMAQVSAGRQDAYFVDEGLLAKFRGRFQEPERSEVDVWIEA